MTTITVSLEAQGIARPPAGLGRCARRMRRERRPRFGPNGVTHPRPWQRPCPNPAAVAVGGVPLCRQHAPRPDDLSPETPAPRPGATDGPRRER